MIDLGHAFAIQTIHGGKHNLDVPLALDDGLFVVDTLPATLDGIWQRWLGEFVSKEITQADLFIVASRPVEHPHRLIVPGDLVDSVRRVLSAMLLIGVPYIDQVHVVGGTNIDGAPRIRQQQTMPTPVVTRGDARYRFGRSDADRIRTLYGTLTALDAEPDEFRRLKRGVRAYFRAVHEFEGEYRLIYLVQALEALIIPPVGKTEAKFTHRGQYIAGANQSNETVLRDAYKLRSQVQHLNTWSDVYPGMPPDECKAIANRRILQIETLARHALGRLFSDRTLLEAFRTDESIREHWEDGGKEEQKEKHQVRRAFWGRGLDLARITFDDNDA